MSPERPTIAVDLRALVGRPTGIGMFTLSLLRELARRGGASYLGMAHAPTVADDELRGLGVRLEARPAPLGVIWQQLHLPARLARGDVDLLWSPLTTLPTRLPVPGVVTVHDLTALLFPEWHRLRVRLSILPFLERTLDAARRIVADSKATADDLRRQFPAARDRVTVVYPGVDSDFRPASAEVIERQRRRLGCPEGYLLFVGTLEPRKNLHLLLDVWLAMRRDDPATPPLVLAGGYGWKSRRLLRRIERAAAEGLVHLGHVRRDELVRLVQAARIFVYPSLYEGFGLPPLEAMACGVPTVTSDGSSLREIAGDAALRVRPDEPEDLAQALRRLLAEPSLASELAARGPRRAAAYRWERAAAEMEAVFTESLQ